LVRIRAIRVNILSAPGQAALVIYINPELEQLRQLVAGAWARLAELEAS
jgi:hypothetical protein